MLKTFKLIDANGSMIESREPGTFGGHRRLKIYGRLDCPSALRYMSRGMYVANRVFFADENTAIAAGYRPCARCLKEEYRDWKRRLEVN